MRNWKLHFITIIATALSFGAAHADPIGEYIKFRANDGSPSDRFGYSVAIDGTTAIVGAAWEEDNGADAGAAYLFNTITGQQSFKLLPNDGAQYDEFGSSVAISGTTAIVGSPWKGPIFSGSAYLFDTTTGKQLFKLTPDDIDVGDTFGFSVAIGGTTAIVGSRWDDDNGSESGSAYLFDVETGKQLFKLLPDDGAAIDEFGVSVAIDGTTAIIGAFGRDDNGSGSGAAYLFDITTGLQILKILPNDGAADDRFGFAVAISGTTALIGAIGSNDNGDDSGAAYLFNTLTGQQVFKLIPGSGNGMNDHFGYSVAINGTMAIVGNKPQNDSGMSTGSASIYDTATGQQIFLPLPSDGMANDRFGSSVAICGTSAIVGAYGNEINGSAYLFDTRIGTPMCDADLNGNGVIDTADLGILLGQFGFVCP